MSHIAAETPQTVLDVRSPDIVVDQVSKAFGDHQALSAVSLEVRKAEFLSILGPSGCGKTTLLRIIGGLEMPDSGTVHLQDKPVTGPTNKLSRLVFQSYALFPHMTAQQNVEFAIQMAKEGDSKKQIVRRAREALELVGVEDRAQAYPSQLSGGQAQRVALARAIVTRPAVLLLDEPLAALDFKLRKRMQVELKSLQRQSGITFVYVTHDQQEALAMSDRVVVMEKGRIAQIGKPNEIYQRPASKYVADFVGDMNFIAGVAERTADGALAARSAALGLVLGTPSGEIEPGDHVSIAIRPEHITATSEPQPGAVEAVLVERSFFGNRVRATAQVDGDQSLDIDLPAASQIMRGDRIFLTWEPSDALILH